MKNKRGWAFALLLCLMICVSTIVLLSNGADTYFAIGEFDCGRETTIRLLSKRLSLEDDLSVYYQIVSKGRSSSPVFFASGRVHETYNGYEQLSYPSLHYRAVFSKEKNIVGITAVECPYDLMVVHDLGRDLSWPRDRAERFAGKAGMLRYFEYCDDLYDNNYDLSPEKKVADRAFLLSQTALYLNGPRIDNRVVLRLPNLPSLRKLDLGWSSVNDEVFQVFKRFEKLQTLNLSMTGVTDNCLPRIRELNSLERIDLSDNKLSNLGISTLFEPGNVLRWVGFWNINVQAMEARRLKESYPRVHFHIGKG